MSFRVAHPMNVRWWERIACAVLTLHRQSNSVRHIRPDGSVTVTVVCECRKRRTTNEWSKEMVARLNGGNE